MPRPIRIGVVDHDGTLLASLRAALDSHPQLQLIGAARTSDEAMALVIAQEPDLLLMDANMPTGGCASTTRRVREHHPLTRVVALAEDGDRASVLEMLRAGATGFVTKGASSEELVAAIQTASQGGVALSAAATQEVAAELSARLSWEEYRERRLDRHRNLVRASLRDGIRSVYQPIFDLRNGSLAGMEALARFPEHRDVPVTVWFRRAAEIGLGAEMELAAMRTAVQGARDRPEGLFLALNMSPVCLQAPSVRRALLDMELAGVVLELTEHAPVQNYDELAAVLAPLRAAGARLAVDDTGAGYASLRHILRLAPDYIKLDIGLTCGIDQEPAKRALATALISFADEIGAAVIAEGVETSRELSALRRLGVPFGQGYALARPAPFREALATAAAAAHAAAPPR